MAQFDIFCQIASNIFLIKLYGSLKFSARKCKEKINNIIITDNVSKNNIM